jgi:hypothetical protein
VLHFLKENKVSILSMSLADTSEFGLLRLIVNDPEKGSKVLNEAGFASTVTEVIIIKLPHVAGALQGILELISENEIDIEYAYGLSVEAEDATIVVKTSQIDKACSVLRENGIGTMSAEELSKL